MNKVALHTDTNHALVEARLASHLPCLREDTTNPVPPAVERLASVRDRAKRIGEIRERLPGRESEARWDGGAQGSPKTRGARDPPDACWIDHPRVVRLPYVPSILILSLADPSSGSES
jgi:hypothetical protein